MVGVGVGVCGFVWGLEGCSCGWMGWDVVFFLGRERRWGLCFFCGNHFDHLTLFFFCFSKGEVTFIGLVFLVF